MEGISAGWALGPTMAIRAGHGGIRAQWGNPSSRRTLALQTGSLLQALQSSGETQCGNDLVRNNLPWPERPLRDSLGYTRGQALLLGQIPGESC